jgi:hypothetical protein
VLSVVNSGNERGLAGKVNDFVTRMEQNQLWPKSISFDRTSLCKARNNIDWREFESIAHKSYTVAQNLWKNKERDKWNGMSVFAMDGSKYTLPATEALRKEFDPHTGLHLTSKGYYPQCLVETAYDVLSYLPVARIVLPCDSSEREAAKKILSYIPPRNVLMLDRGYPGFGFIRHLNDNYNGKILIRCPASNTIKEVMTFVRSGKSEDIVTLLPSKSYLAKLTTEEKLTVKPITLRLIRLKSPDGTLSVLLTNMNDNNRFTAKAIRNLYFKRYRIEEYFRHEKGTIKIEHFHSNNSNGIKQELFAAMIVSIIARLMVNIQTEPEESGVPQFKNAVISFALDAALLTPVCPNVAINHFMKLLDRIAKIKYYRPKKPRKTYPRITKSASNKWIKKRSACT